MRMHTDPYEKENYKMKFYLRYKNNKSVALQPRRAKTDWSGCYQLAVQGTLWLAKRLSLNLNFSFLNRISLLLISSSDPIVFTRLGRPRSRPYTSRKISMVQPGIEPGTSWMAVRRANHYTKQVHIYLFLYLKHLKPIQWVNTTNYVFWMLVHNHGINQMCFSSLVGRAPTCKAGDLCFMSRLRHVHVSK